jgi:hypothetical protein
MQRKRPDDKIERFREDRATSELIDLKRQVERWAGDNVSSLKGADPDISKALNDRAADNWRILLAIADSAGGHWPDTARRVAVLISGDEEDTSLSVQLLHDIHDIFDAAAVDRLSGANIVDRLVARDDRPWATLVDGQAINAYRLASMLDPFGIRPKVLRIGDKTPRGYERSQFADAWERYPRPQTATPQQSSKINSLGEDQTATQTATGSAESATGPAGVADRPNGVADHVAVAEAEKYNDFNSVADVAVWQGGAPKRPLFDAEAFLNQEHPIPRRRRKTRRADSREGDHDGSD